MNNDIEEDIENIYDLIQWADDNNTNATKECKSFENILADRERLEKENENWEKYNLEKEEEITQLNNELVEVEAKANKYDSLVEKLKEKISERSKRINKLHSTNNCELIDDIEREIKVLQKLLDAVEEVHNDNIIY